VVYPHLYYRFQAVADKAVVPLLYEGRAAKLNINKYQIDKGFDRLAEPLSEYATKDLKKKFSTITQIYESQQVVEEIAYDISKHFSKKLGKALVLRHNLLLPKIETAIRYQKYFEGQNQPWIKDQYGSGLHIHRIQDKAMMMFGMIPREKEWNTGKCYFEKYHSQDEYEDYIISKFKDKDDEVEVIIVSVSYL